MNTTSAAEQQSGFKLKTTVKAWLSSPEYLGIDRLQRMLSEGETEKAADELTFSNADMDEGNHPWLQVGTAEVEVTLFSVNGVTAKQIEVLETALKRERAESIQRQSAILERISKLQALTYEAPEAA